MKQETLLEFPPKVDVSRYGYAHRLADKGELQGAGIARLTSGQKRKRLLDALEAAGIDGCTDWELHLKTKIPMSSVTSCRNSLFKDGFVEKAPFRRKSPVSSAELKVWRTTAEEWPDQVRAS